MSLAELVSLSTLLLAELIAVADFDKKVATSYGVLLRDGVPLRALFVIDPAGAVSRVILSADLSVFIEMSRLPAAIVCMTQLLPL